VRAGHLAEHQKRLKALTEQVLGGLAGERAAEVLGGAPAAVLGVGAVSL
jgi:hypothetical protein